MSPVTNAIVTMIVASVSPKTISTVCARRRGMLRSPIFTTNGRRRVKKTSTDITTATAITTPSAMSLMSAPKILFMAALLRPGPPGLL